jgi:hypothetical protein
VFSVCREITGELLIWFTTVQKLPFVAVLSAVLNNKILLFVLLGIVISNFQAILYKRFRQLVILGRTERIGWRLL